MKMGTGCSHAAVIGFLENEIHGSYSIGLVKFWDSCKCRVFNLLSFAKACFENFLCSSALEPDTC